MAQGQDRASEFVQDIESGVSDTVLQQKHGLPKDKCFVYKASALDFIEKEKTGEFKENRTIDPYGVLADLALGLDDETLMVRDDVNPSEFQNVLRQFIEAGLASPLHICSHHSITKSQVRDAFVEIGKAIRKLD
jgi:hypothetical protein